MDIRREIDTLKERKNKPNVAFNKINDLVDKVQKNSHAVIVHADAIRAVTKTPTDLMTEMEGEVQEVQKQGQKSKSQFKSMKALVENQREKSMKKRPEHTTYAEKAAMRGQQREQSPAMQIGHQKL